MDTFFPLLMAKLADPLGAGLGGALVGWCAARWFWLAAGVVVVGGVAELVSGVTEPGYGISPEGLLAGTAVALGFAAGARVLRRVMSPES